MTEKVMKIITLHRKQAGEVSKQSGKKSKNLLTTKRMTPTKGHSFSIHNALRTKRKTKTLILLFLRRCPSASTWTRHQIVKG